MHVCMDWLIELLSDELIYLVFCLFSCPYINWSVCLFVHMFVVDLCLCLFTDLCMYLAAESFNFLSIHVREFLQLSIYWSTYIFIYVFIVSSIYLFMYSDVQIFALLFVRIFMYAFTYIYTHIYIYMYILFWTHLGRNRVVCREHQIKSDKTSCTRRKSVIESASRLLRHRMHQLKAQSWANSNRSLRYIYPPPRVARLVWPGSKLC